MKIKIKSGYNCRGVEFMNDGVFEFEMEKFDIKEVLEKYLVKEFGSKEECLRYFVDEMNGVEESFEDVIDGILEVFEFDKDNEYMNGELMVSEEGFIRVYVDGKLYVG